jgi:hypothetical protein
MQKTYKYFKFSACGRNVWTIWFYRKSIIQHDKYPTPYMQNWLRISYYYGKIKFDRNVN